MKQFLSFFIILSSILAIILAIILGKLLSSQNKECSETNPPSVKTHNQKVLPTTCDLVHPFSSLDKPSTAHNWQAHVTKNIDGAATDNCIDRLLIGRALPSSLAAVLHPSSQHYDLPAPVFLSQTTLFVPSPEKSIKVDCKNKQRRNFKKKPNLNEWQRVGNPRSDWLQSERSSHQTCSGHSARPARPAMGRQSPL